MTSNIPHTLLFKQNQQKITLCMIVKDEANVITRALDSVRDFVDFYCICDTGSTDDTQKTILDYFKKHDLKGAVYDRPWVNFSHNRNECFELAKGTSDYIMTLDADEVVVSIINDVPDTSYKIRELPTFETDMVYGKTILINDKGQELRYVRHQFFKNGLDWVWKHPLHEFCSKEGRFSTSVLDDFGVIPTSDGARAKDPNKYKKDALTIETYLLDNEETSRDLFYLAQSYGDANLPDEAVNAIDRALKKLTWDQEIYVAHLRRGRWREKVGESFDEVMSDYIAAFNTIPTRSEAILELIRGFSQKDQINNIILFGEIALNNPEPHNTTLFVEADAYAWRIKAYVAIAYCKKGEKSKANPHIIELLDDPRVPNTEKENIRNTVYLSTR